ncbi:MAG: DUF4189 domain-containing protein [Variovorax sp.]|jgi:hypothetical protein|nr:MAG: DUF4189 domain-containing protein [Variovorax sp.]
MNESVKMSFRPPADPARRPSGTGRAPRPPHRWHGLRAGLVALLLGVGAAAGLAAPAAVPQTPRAGATWGAIAARADGYGYAFNQPSRAAAEQVARAQCERPAGTSSAAPAATDRPGGRGTCEIRVWFQRGCAALATGNFGEWGTATGTDQGVATRAAVAQCDAHLPTEPCRVAVGICSSP